MLPVLSDRRMFMIAVTPESFASLKFAPARKGIHEIAASGASSPARVRIYARIGDAGRPSNPLSVSAYFSACQTRPRPRPLSL